MRTGSNQPPTKKVRYTAEDDFDIESKPVVVRVGVAEKVFYVHEKLLRSNSRFFAIALKKEWKEGQDREVKLPKADVDAFKVWSKWLYTGRMSFRVLDSTDTQDDSHRGTNSNHWAETYRLGDYLQDPDFKDAAIDVLIDEACDIGLVPALLATYVYPYSSTQSMHRKLAVELTTRYWARADFSLKEDHPQEFLKDVIIRIMPDLSEGIKNVLENELFNPDDSCKYHDHGPDKPCYKKKPRFRQ